MIEPSYYNKATALADFVCRSWDPKMKWMWGEALLGFALARLDDFQGTHKYQAFLQAYCDYYVAHPPRMDQSDTIAPALITYAMQKKTGNTAYKALTDRALHYIINEPRLIGDSVNHLGNSLEGKLYPKSIWVDSLMMFSVFPSLYAREQNKPDLMDIAARQPRTMAKYLMDNDDKLWYHAYWVRQQTHYPRSKIFWGRGNGWVIASLPMILENIGDHPERDEIITMFYQTSAALLPLQREDGCFETVLNKPGKTYRELSATALIASGWLQGCRMGFLDEKYRAAGKRAFEAVCSALVETNGGISMPEVSAPTIPLPLFPYLGYKYVPLGSDWSYGIAALIFAAIEYRRLEGE
ncbi:MAG: glycoside hydrolase family 88 protein [Spirochaetes bacterium]|nr:glycoside hydrolase family 88 protein [Spirochaetota bacterium]MBU0956461.1 glycoside hydrolase family 88 protein [Spirochaetota bacterium]